MENKYFQDMDLLILPLEGTKEFPVDNQAQLVSKFMWVFKFQKFQQGSQVLKVSFNMTRKPYMGNFQVGSSQ